MRVKHCIRNRVVGNFVRPIGLIAREIPLRLPAVIHVQVKTHRIVPIIGCEVAVYGFSLEHESS